MRLKALVLALTAITPAARGQAGFPNDSAVRAIIKQRVDEGRSAGIVIGLIDPDGKQRIIAYGDPGPNRMSLDANSVFEIGSISKVFTATLLAQMVSEGKVKLDDPVQKYLPSSVHIPARNGRQITLGDLSEQHSGLPRMPDNFKPADTRNPYADYTVQQLYEFLSAYQLPRDPGATFEYSNLGVGLLGHVLSLVAGKSYEQLVTERILAPLGMTHSAITFTPWMTDHLALGHDEQGNVVANWDIPTFAGAGAIRSTTTDMLRFADANLHPERGALQSAMATAQAVHKQTAPTQFVGLNWFSQVSPNDTITWHNGGTGGYRTFIGLNRQRKMAVVVMTNTTGAGADDIGLHLLNPVIPLVPKPSPIKQRTAIEMPAAALARYVGTYSLAPNFDLVITAEGDGLYMQPTGQSRLRLWPESDTDFFIKEVDVQVTFEKNPAGFVSSLILHQNGRSLPAAKTK